MKTLTISQARPRLAKLVDEVHSGAPVVLVHKNKLVKLERYEPLDPEYDSARLEAMLLEGVKGPFLPYSSEEMKAVLRKSIRRARKAK